MAEMRVGTDHRALLYVSACPGSYETNNDEHTPQLLFPCRG